MLDKSHNEFKQFLRMFKVIDAQRVKSASVQNLVRKDLDAKVLETAFYKLDL